MFLFVLNDYPSGLNYYYFVSTLISVGTMILLRKTTDETKLLAILEAKKKRPETNEKDRICCTPGSYAKATGTVTAAKTE